MSFPDNKLTVRSSADLATAVPYLIGFYPGDGSIVVIACRDRRIVFAARADLPAPGSPAHHLRDLTAHLVPVVQRQQPITDLVIVGYGAQGHIDPALRGVGDAFTAAGLAVRELLRVTGNRIFSLTCGDPGCCPPQGTPVEPTTSLFAVHATVAGLVARPDRAAVASRFTRDDSTGDGIRHATTEATARMTALETNGSTVVSEAGAHAVRSALRQHDDGTGLTDDEVAWLTVLLTHRPVRDLAVDFTQPHDQHVTFWAEVTRRADEALVPAPATILALTAWRFGDGALALMAAERALQVDPDYQLAGLLLQALHAGLPPSVFEQATTSTQPNPSNPNTLTEQE
ncbi:DUF4192 domain-containing protein [Micromonospora sp. NBRC 107095]|uniref:DUF4192 domain-containing protein n=1 Tax=Micromonospora sp. NBRC 107095 TaxID=3032209 RepID=UPI0024A4170A|nr:DUF4192 domain-containing protein [Micromonospora sp. NBRC 107095]GLZ60958.1 hypothetical protein Misp05_45340 [Micromonospora sp. NBRC 107095]